VSTLQIQQFNRVTQLNHFTWNDSERQEGYVKLNLTVPTTTAPKYDGDVQKMRTAADTKIQCLYNHNHVTAC
jgi:hypothetical protein